ncbi:DNA (cytosine-5)-methyltransferase CMT2 isoform X2 [Senna tora]|uniref:DNA (cytosine-5-)-methyltransferase n=1 Tax=Senna tora TaxID=362788 RepID=A0A834SSA1_9FABA|nr:DNA (cytosine-5)-methyltransferase CMT2 isoform X2 [Senna tora]
MRSPRKSNSLSKSKPESSSLFLVEFSGLNPYIPLKIVSSKCSSQLPLRRSPRFTQNCDESINSAASQNSPELRSRKSSKQLRLVHANDLRRSPRLNPANAGVRRSISGSGLDTPGKSGSTKFRHRLGNFDSMKSDEKCLRRSPRFSAPAVIIGTESHSPNYDFVEWQRCRGQGLQLKPINASCPCSDDLADLKTISSGENCLRRSPRLSSTPSECERLHPNTLSLKLKSPKKGYLGDVSRNDSSLHLVSCCHKNSNKGTLPLKHCQVDCFGKKDFRKSPTLNPTTRQHSSETSMENLEVKLLDGLKFRRSPRLSRQQSSETSMENLEVKLLDGLEFRRSPRLSRQQSSEASMKNLEVKLLDGFRRSPRLSSPSEKKNLKIILQEKETSEVIHQNKKSSKSNCTSVKLSNSSNEQHSKVASDSGKTGPTHNIFEKNCKRGSSELITSQSDNGRAKCDSFVLPKSDENPPKKKFKTSVSLTNESKDQDSISSFIGDPIPDNEAQKIWGWRYELKDKKYKGKTTKINEDEEDETIVNVECHYAQAKIGNCIFSLGDCAFIKGEGEQNCVGKIVEFFQTTDKENFFRVQWFYRIEDTVVQDQGNFHDKRRLFYSSIMNDNLIDCIIAKANVTHIRASVGIKLTSILPSDFYYDMEYCVDYSTFRSIPTDSHVKSGKLSSPIALETTPTVASTITKNNISNSESNKVELALLDLYSGCGGMSTGLCLGAKVSSVNLVTRWAVDSDESACKSLKLNHPETHVRNESTEDFLDLLKEWEKLCKRFEVSNSERKVSLRPKSSEGEKEQVKSQVEDLSPDEFEVSRLVDICYGDPSETGKRGLYFKVRWKGYNASEDTWEPIEGLTNCQERIQDFVRDGMKSKILPLPGATDVICGGPPCQGISGYNRFRNATSPLDDERNRQIVVFMDIVKFLKPKYVLMENVADILRFDKASLGRYALSRLVHMKYQAKLGTVAAGCYGLPQFRLRVFLWGAHPDEVLPQFPLPTHEVIVRYWPPPEFERNTVALDEGQPRELEKAVVIQDAISDLPAVTYSENREEMPYQNPPATEFQRYIRSSKYEMTGSTSSGMSEKSPVLYDHRSYLLSEDDYLRVCQIPKRKGANFRDLPGVIVGANNVVRRDPTDKLVLLPSGKPLVPDYAFTFDQGKSKRPFSRLWWDETVPTVLTFPSCHNQTILHPEQDRILTIRECARLQGFPDYYQFCGTIKERYCQIGNAVAVSVGRALGYAVGMASRKLVGDEPLMTLPPKFSHSNYLHFTNDNHTD